MRDITLQTDLTLGGCMPDAESMSRDDIVKILAKMRILLIAMSKFANDTHLVTDMGAVTISDGRRVSEAALQMKRLALDVINLLGERDDLNQHIIPDDISDAADEIMLATMPPSKWLWKQPPNYHA